MSEFFKKLKGTASEMSDNHAYTVFEEKYGAEAAKRAFINALAEREITFENWRTYRSVKKTIQNNPLNGKAILKTADKEASEMLEF